jgi:hypothetical protein
MTMNIANFDDLLRAARGQPEPQRLLFVFAGAELPEDATPEQRARFEAGEGGALVPRVSVDKMPGELETFTALVEESHQFGHWSVVFVAGLSGRGGRPPTSDEADQALQRMTEAIKTGAFGSFMPFDRQGNPVLID